jgi:hypothetical protein
MPKTDAPDDPTRPYPLLSLNQMSRRHVTCHLPSRVFTTSDQKGYIIVIEMIHGQTTQDIVALRHEEEHDLLNVCWPSRLAGGGIFEHLLTSGEYEAYGPEDVMRLYLNPTDHNLLAIKNQMDEFVGPRNIEVCQTTMCFRLRHKIKPTASPWVVTLADGENKLCFIFIQSNH